MIKPILWVNKLDRIFLELHMDIEEAFGCFRKAIESVNVNIATFSTNDNDQVEPTAGKVGFGAGLHGWGFNLNRFARMYASKFGVAYEKMMQKLWGDNFFNPKNKKWTVNMYTPKGDKLERAFCTFILKPIRLLTDAIMDNKPDVYLPMLTKLNVTIPKDAKDLTCKPLLKRVMQTWLPAAETLLQMIVNHLPSPRVAQAYRMPILYSGPHDDKSAIAISKCDPDGPLMMYVSKMVPTSEKGRFYAFGRVFSGRIATGQTCRIYGPDYEHGQKKDLHIKKIQRTVLMMGRYVEQLPSCACGNIIGLVGVDSYLLKSGTICTDDDAWPLNTLKFSVSPVVRVAVEVKNASDLPKLMEGLKRLAKSDPLVLCTTAPTGEHIVAGAGELHLEICLKDLAEDFMKGAPIVISDPVVSFRECISGETQMDIIAKSPNKHNRIYMRAGPLAKEFGMAVDTGELRPDGEAKERARVLADKFGWDKTEALKLWTFGCPPDGIANVLVDQTKGVQYMNEIKDSCVGAFIQATAAGVIAEEAMRNSRFNIMDVTMHADAIHRGAGQIMPPTKRAMYACQIKSEPRILEPMYLCDITVPADEINGVYATLNARRGEVDAKEDQPGTPICKIRAFLPVLESFGFTGLLREKTHGKAFPQMIFDKWQDLNGNPFEEGTQAHGVVMAARKRKGLKDELPKFGDYYDKM
jgi:elongation factor 2